MECVFVDCVGCTVRAALMRPCVDCACCIVFDARRCRCVGQVVDAVFVDLPVSTFDTDDDGEPVHAHHTVTAGSVMLAPVAFVRRVARQMHDLALLLSGSDHTVCAPGCATLAYAVWVCGAWCVVCGRMGIYSVHVPMCGCVVWVGDVWCVGMRVCSVCGV